MQIKDYKIIKKETHNSSRYYVKFKRMIFGLIPMWIFLHSSHYGEEYRYDRHSLHVILLNIPIVILNIIYPSNFFFIPYLISIFYLIWALVFLYSVGSRMSYHDSYDDNGVKSKVKTDIDNFNRIFDKSYKSESVIFSSEKKKDKKLTHYQINIPKIKTLVKKYVY